MIKSTICPFLHVAYVGRLDWGLGGQGTRLAATVSNPRSLNFLSSKLPYLINFVLVLQRKVLNLFLASHAPQPLGLFHRACSGQRWFWSHVVLHLTPNPQWPATQLGPPVLFLCLFVLLVHSRWWAVLLASWNANVLSTKGPSLN